MELGASSKKVKTLPNWLDLPRDLTIQIFINIGIFDLICNAQFVCSSWRAIARDPRLYRVLDLRYLWNHFDDDYKNYNYELVVKLVTEVIDRSCGQAIAFSLGRPDYGLKMDILDQLQYKTPGLQRLRLSSCSCVDHECMIKVLPNLPLLEEVEFFNCYFSNQVLEVLGRSCPNLKSFLMVIDEFDEEDYVDVLNEYAFAIAGYMNPSLRSLDLFANLMTNTGLEAILDRFSQLEYLDLRQCVNLDLNGDLLKRCQRIKTVRLPRDSTKDSDHEFEKMLSSEDEEDGKSDKDEDDDSDCRDGESDKDEDGDSDCSYGESDKDEDGDSAYNDGDSVE